jgi:hypothetical protein
MAASGKELRASLTLRLFGGALLAVPLPLFVVIVARAAERGVAVGAGLVLTIVGGLLGTIMFFARWRVDEHGIERLTPLTRRMRIAWSDVVWIRRGGMGSLIVAGRYGTTVQVPVGLTGMDELRRLAIAHVADDSISDDVLRSFDARSGESRGPRAVPVDAPEPADLPHKDPVVRWRENPFFVLDLTPECSRADVERAGQKLLALLAIDSSAAKRVRTPLGDAERTADAVRAAMAELRDPDRRFLHEAWARIPPDAEARVEPPRSAVQVGPWPEAIAAIGWRGK